MPAQLATAADLPVLRRLLRMGRNVFYNLADEDLPSVVNKGLTLLVGERGHAWGALAVDPEQPRPPSLSPGAPNRAQVRALALRYGPWNEAAGDEMVAGLRALTPAALRPLLVSVYAGEPWLRTMLEKAGFALADTVIFFRLTGLSTLEIEEPQAPAALRPARLGDVEPLAELDAATFDTLWHFAAPDIVEMLVRGRVLVAERAGPAGTGTRLVGYSALLTASRHEAHLARLAVHPDLQGQGLGRALLLESLHYAQHEGYAAMALNTQATNQRSQALYRSVGFQASGIALPVLTLTLPEAQDASAAS